MKDIAIQFTNVGKLFPGVKALDEVTFDIKKGELHCIVGENGAGKSTLIKILAGVHQHDEGEIRLFGKIIDFKNPEQAKKRGIGVVYQELSNFEHLDVSRNLFVNNYPIKMGRIDYNKLYKQARERLNDCGLTYIDEHSIMKEISLGSQQMVEIASLIGENAKVVVFDEPTSALTEIEVKKLYELIARMKEQDITIIYISHRLDEVIELADVITVLKDGKHMTTFQRDENTTKEMLVNYMVGRDVEFDYKAGTGHVGDVMLQVENLCSRDTLNNISFDVRHGEIFGIAGLEGSGRTELLETIYGWRKITEGSIKLNGKKVEIKNSIQAKKKGFAYITKDRKNLGLFLGLDVKKNISAASMEKYLKHGTINYKMMAENSKKYIDAIRIKCSSLEQKTMNLSGGNQQKVLLSMWLSADPDIVLIDEPTRGVDVGAKEEIHTLLREIVSMGKSVIMVSSELPELIASCDRILVMYEGKKMGELNHNELTEQQMMSMASGILN